MRKADIIELFQIKNQIILHFSYKQTLLISNIYNTSDS